MKATMKKILSVILTLALIFVPTSVLEANAGATLVWPVPGHTHLTGTFSSSHQAIDISDGSIGGATVVCAMGGTVERIYLCGNNHQNLGDCSGFGTGVVIKGDDGRHYQYAHMEAGSIPSNVYYGAYVPTGAQVGRVGNTGWSTGNHLHFQIGTTGIFEGCVDPMLETYGSLNLNPADIGTDFYGIILNTASSKPISKNAVNNNITLESENGTSMQKWHFSRQSDGAYVIISCYDGKVLEMTDGIKTNCTPASAKDTFWGGYYQQWYLIPQGNGYVFLNKHYSDEQWVLDLYENNNADGNSIEIYQRNNSNAQIWSVYAEEDVQLGVPTLYVSTDSANADFFWNEVYGETSYTLGIWDNKNCEGKAYKTFTTPNQFSYSATFPEGTYYAKVTASDYFAAHDSNVVEFVIEKTETQPTTKPTESVTQPTTTRPAPTTTKPAPTTTTRPAPTTTKPAPTTTKPAPTTTRPAPTTTKPVPTTKPMPVKDEIIRRPSRLRIDYGETLILHADLASIPEGTRVEWSVEGNGATIMPSEDGLTCSVTSVSTGIVTVKAKYVDSNGVEHSSEQELESRAGIWQIIVYIFKVIFRIPTVIPQIMKYKF